MSSNLGNDRSARRLRVGTWNMNHWQRSLAEREAGWAHLGNSAGVDVALLQETEPPRGIDHGRLIYREIAGYRPWGSAVYAVDDTLSIEEIWSVRTRWSKRRYTLANTFPGSVAVARVSIPEIDPVTVVSVYNIIDDVYAQTTLLRIVADLIPLFDSPDGSRVILGGDLNMSTAAAKGPERDRAASILGALKGLGLVDLADVELAEGKRPEPWPDCPCQEPDCRHFPTWRAGHLDHLFVTPALTDQVRSLHVDRDVVERGLSDHAALIATLDLDPRPIAHEWDPKTFVEEIRRRHGEEDARTVEELIAWAEVKEQSLRVANRRDRSLTRLPVSAEVDPEMWWQIDFPPERPTAIQWTLSIRGDW